MNIYLYYDYICLVVVKFHWHSRHRCGWMSFDHSFLYVVAFQAVFLGLFFQNKYCYTYRLGCYSFSYIWYGHHLWHISSMVSQIKLHKRVFGFCVLRNTKGQRCLLLCSLFDLSPWFRGQTSVVCQSGVLLVGESSPSIYLIHRPYSGLGNLIQVIYIYH